MSAQIARTKTVVVLGAAYGGSRAAQILAAGIPAGWRVVLVDRNSHANHVYVLPRLAVLPGHEHKAFIPYDKVFLLDKADTPNVCLRAHVTAFNPNSVTLSQAFPEHGIPTPTLHFDYAVYALGSHLPLPLNLWGSAPNNSVATPKVTADGGQRTTYRGLKAEGVVWLRENQKLIEDSLSVLIVGGGALGIQFATDIAAVHPTKRVTLLHSRQRLLPRYDEAMHTEILQSLESFNVEVILGERLDLQSLNEGPIKTNELGQRVARTMKGREVAADLLLLCTGQTPNTELLKEMDPTTVNPEDSLAHVLRTMQLGVLPLASLPNSPGSVATPATPIPAPTQAKVDNVPVTSDANELEAALDQLALADKEESQTEISDPQEPSDELEDQASNEQEALEETPYPNIFVIGDAADAFGAIAAGHNAYYQGELAARNIIRLIQRQEKAEDSTIEDEPLERYTPGAPAIKVSLGLTKSVYQINGTVGVNNDGREDLHASAVWAYFGHKVEQDEEMYAKLRIARNLATPSIKLCGGDAASMR